MPTFFSKFPVVRYDVNNEKYSYKNSQLATNVLFRIAIIKEVLENTSSYYEHTVRDEERPEILADKVYNDPEAHWIILYANNMLDPQYDWVLDYRSFQKYLADKYRAQAEIDLGTGIEDYQVIDWTRDTNNANSVHHYEKIITRTNVEADVTSEQRIRINYDEEWINAGTSANVDSYLDTPAESFEVFNKANTLGATIYQTIKTNKVTYYDYEEELNERKRNIKVIKNQYYGQIMSEFDAITNSKNYTRRLI